MKSTISRGSIVTGRVSSKNSNLGVSVTITGGTEAWLGVSEFKGGTINAQGRRGIAIQVGDKIKAVVIKSNPRDLWISERQLQNAKVLQGLKTGATVKGTITEIKNNGHETDGAVITIKGGIADGVDVFLPVSQLPNRDKVAQTLILADDLKVGDLIIAEVSLMGTWGKNLYIELSQLIPAERAIAQAVKAVSGLELSHGLSSPATKRAQLRLHALRRFPVGTAHNGAVAKHTDKGTVLVRFGDEISGWLPEDDNTRKLKRGQYVRVLVRRVSSAGQLKLTFLGLTD